jgi:hypothetical protein
MYVKQLHGICIILIAFWMFTDIHTDGVCYVLSNQRRVFCCKMYCPLLKRM